MATARAGARKTTRRVTLSLTEGEADLLVSLLASVGGHPTKSPRKYARRMLTALEGALGYDYEATDAHPLSVGIIHFHPYGSSNTTDRDRAELFVEMVRNGLITPA